MFIGFMNDTIVLAGKTVLYEVLKVCNLMNELLL